MRNLFEPGSTTGRFRMARKRKEEVEGQVLLFPKEGASQDATPPSRKTRSRPESSDQQVDTVICGTYRKDVAGLRRTFEELRDSGFRVLSPSSMDIVSEKDGFVYMKGEEGRRPDAIEEKHLKFINSARMVWLHAPEGYIGPTAAMEIGYARASGIPVFSSQEPKDEALKALVAVVPTPQQAKHLLHDSKEPPLPMVQTFQSYYARAAIERGYEKENAQNCLLLMLEEFGELARAIRKKSGLKRDSLSPVSEQSQELADVFIYVVHMANVLGLDLAEAVQAKESKNISRFLARRSQ